MDRNKPILIEVAILAIGEIVCVGLMLLIFALLGKFTTSVWLGALIGAAVAIANYFFMGVGVARAADKAEKGEEYISKASSVIRTSSTVRLFALLVILAALLYTKKFNPIATLLPLLFARPVITVAEFFRKTH